MIQIERKNTPSFWCWRLARVNRALQRAYLFDWTVTRLYAGKPSYWRIAILGRRFEGNRRWSGLPGARIHG